MLRPLVAWALSCACALSLCAAPAEAQDATYSAAPAGYAPQTALVLVPAKSTPLEGSASATGVTATLGGATYDGSGVTRLGPLVPVLGRDIRVVLSGTWAGSVQIGTSSAANACAAGTINPLTVGGAAWGNYTSNVNEAVDTPTLGGTIAADGKTILTAAPVYCATVTITSGTLVYRVRQ